MKDSTQALVMTVVAALLLRLSLSEEHLRFVNAWMRWPLVATGLLLLALSVVHVTRPPEEPGETGHHDPPAASWLLVLPVLVVFVVAPPALGSYVAERRSNQVPASSVRGLQPMPAGESVELSVSEFVVRAQFDEANSLDGRTVALDGFVSTDPSGLWYVTRLSLNCCAADAVAFRVRVDGAEAPRRDEWVRVEGVWAGSDQPAPRDDMPVLNAASVSPISAPASPYE